jgi:hypothetical protein
MVDVVPLEVSYLPALERLVIEHRPWLDFRLMARLTWCCSE